MADTRNFANKVANEGSADVYLEDAKLSEKTSQNSVASTDYVLLEDTDGAYHKIAKNSFDEAVRSSLGSMLMNLDKGTSVAGIPAIGSTGNDLGSVTLSNLASLLGVFQNKGAIVHTKQETVTNDGIYIVNGTNANTVLTDDGFLLVGKSGYYRVKIGVTNAKIAVKEGTKEWSKLGGD